LVGLASNFVVGVEVIPLDAEKHTETPLMEGIDPARVTVMAIKIISVAARAADSAAIVHLGGERDKSDYLSVLTAIFPCEPGLASFIEAKDDGGGGDDWSGKSCKAPVKSSPSTNQHPAIYRPDALPVAPPTVSKH